MQKIKKILINNCAFIIVLMLLVAPVFSFAQVKSGLVPCDNTPTTTGTGKDAKVEIKNPCDFNALMTLINTVIHFVLFYMVIPIAAIMFFYAGFKMVTSGGSSESKTQAKNIFTNTVIGLVVAVGAWLIIKTILSILGYDGGWIGFPK